MLFAHFASKNQQPGFYISATLAWNGLLGHAEFIKPTCMNQILLLAFLIYCGCSAILEQVVEFIDHHQWCGSNLHKKCLITVGLSHENNMPVRMKH